MKTTSWNVNDQGWESKEDMVAKVVELSKAKPNLHFTMAVSYNIVTITEWTFKPSEFGYWLNGEYHE